MFDGGQSVPEVCEIFEIGSTALHRWVEQVRKEREGKVPAGAKAITPDQQRIHDLEALVRQKDRDIEIKRRSVLSFFGAPKIVLADPRVE